MLGRVSPPALRWASRAPLQLRCRIAHQPCALPRTVVPHHVERRSVSSKTASKKSTTVSWGELPSAKLDEDGVAVGPLDPAGGNEPSRIGRQADKKGKKKPTTPRSIAAEEAEWAKAVASGQVPDTSLSKLVWQNWKRFPDCILLTQVGNFYESYFEPAIEVSSMLGIKLTTKKYKQGRHPFTGFPIHQLDKYLKVLVQDLGRTVVLVEEKSDPFQIKDPNVEVERKVARVVTPGTLVDDSWISGSENRFLLAMVVGDVPLRQNEEGGNAQYPIYLAYADVSTGEFFTKEATTQDIEDELARIAPREIVLDAKWRDLWQNGDVQNTDSVMKEVVSLLRSLGGHLSFTDTPTEDDETPTKTGVYSPLALERSAIRILHHHLEYALRDNMPTMPEKPEDFNRESPSNHMHIDAATLHALEVRHSVRPGDTSQSSSQWLSPLSAKGTLLSVISRTVTDSGHRLLRRTLGAPSTDLTAINSRLSLVSAFVDRGPLRTDLRDQMKLMVDVMRIIQRFRSRRGDGFDVWDVAKWVRDVERLMERIKIEVGSSGKRTSKKALEQAKGLERLSEALAAFTPLQDLAEEIEAAIDESKLPNTQSADEDEDLGIIEEPSAPLPKGETRREEELRKRKERFWLRPDFSTELTELHRRLLRLERKQEKLQTKLQEDFAAPSLLLTRSTRGTLTVTVKKKTEFGGIDRSGDFSLAGETKSTRSWTYKPWTDLGEAMDATCRDLDLAQHRALNRLRALVLERSSAIQRNAELVDEFDMTIGFAQVAVDRGFVRPELNDGVELSIINGRHPSVEAGLQASARMFTPNSTHMTPNTNLHVVTGPNQGGKSTLLRQTAVIAILAQAGSFVPADSARIGIIDRVFSRIGARDDLFRDRSTFMLEMVETAAILKHATPRSLVIMDEIGRGTTLHAGISIAYATLDYILSNIKCRTLFATHYHELAHMLGVPAPPVGSTGVKGVAPLDRSNVRPGVAFWCTDVEEMDGLFAYSYRLKPGINYNSHAIKAAQLAGMPDSFLQTAEKVLQELESGPNTL